MPVIFFSSRFYRKILTASFYSLKAQVETLLKTQEGGAPLPQSNDFSVPVPSELPGISKPTSLPNGTSAPISPPEVTGNQPLPGQIYLPPPFRDSNNSAWDMISLGLEEPLPVREVVDELYVKLRCLLRSLSDSHNITEIKSTSKKSTPHCPYYTGRGIWRPWIWLPMSDPRCVCNTLHGAMLHRSLTSIMTCMSCSISGPVSMPNWRK